MRVGFLVAVAVAVTGVEAQAQEAPADLRAKVDAYLGSLVDLGMFSGAVLIAKDGHVLVEAAYGEADYGTHTPNQASTQFKLMSVSKSLTAIAAMRLMQAGKLDVTVPVGKYLPDWPAAWADVTVRQLLDHTSGIPNLELQWTLALSGGERGLAVWKALAPTLAGKALETKPGALFRYSNFNYVLVGCVLESATGKPYRDVLRAEVLEPAHLEHTGFDDGSRRPGLSLGYFRGVDGEPDASEQDMSRIQAAGGFFSTVGDLYRLDRALRGEDLLTARTRAYMVTPLRAANGYACGWINSPVEGHTCFQHSGGSNGYVADFLRFPEDDACVVVMSNFAFARITHISWELARLLFGKPATLGKRVPAGTLDGWGGVYLSPATGRAAFVCRSGKVLMVFNADGKSEQCVGDLLLPLADDRFLLPKSREIFRFAAGGEGRPAILRVEAFGGPIALERVDPPVAKWRRAVGEYSTEIEEDGPLKIEGSDGRFVLRNRFGQGTFDLVLLTETMAIARYGGDGGSLVHLAREGDRVVGLRWQRPGGHDVRATRREG